MGQINKLFVANAWLYFKIFSPSNILKVILS